MKVVQPFIGMNELPSLHSNQRQAALTLPTPGPPAQTMEAVMRDEIFDRDYQAGRDALNDGIDRLFASIGRTLRVLYSLQFDAPWKHDATEGSARSVR